MKWILRPLDDSNDLVLICDERDTVLAALHMDTFSEMGVDAGPIYAELWNGRTVTVEVKFVDANVDVLR